MLSGEDNENGEKTTISLISKKTTLHLQHTFFVHFFAVVLHDHNVKLLETGTCCCSLFFTRSFSPRWPLGFLIFSPTLKHFHVVLPTNSSLSSALALCRSFSRGASLACRPLYFFSIFQICGHDNWSKLNTLDNKDNFRFPFSSLLTFKFSLLHKTRVAMRFPAKITSSCIWVAIPVVWVILHCYACGADGRSVGRTVKWLPKFLGAPLRVELHYNCVR